MNQKALVITGASASIDAAPARGAPAMTARIRHAAPDDADAMSHVRARTWQTTYRGLVPDAYLDAIDVEGWAARRRTAIERAEGVSLVAEFDGRVVGFTSAGKNRDAEPPWQGELYAIYILAEHHGRGIGRRLFDATAEALLASGHRSMHLWVLRGNPARGFYERLGGRWASERAIEIGGVTLQEDSMGWDDLARPAG